MIFSLYLHIPYCLTKCPYCDFNAYAATAWPEERYVDALGAELRHYLTQPPWQGQTIETIYFGGGTPSLFAPASVERVLTLVKSLCPLASRPEISLEVDPASASPARLTGYRAIGVNRLSLGTQSFQPALLKTLGRLHTAEDAARTIMWARASGFTNLSLDLIFAVPGQTLEMLASDVTQALAYIPEHLSTYNLTYEENTPFFAMRQKGYLQPIDEETEIEMYRLVQEHSADAGYVHYEVSSFSRPGFPSQHNANYWNGRSYLGLGAGAHSFVNQPGWGQRWSNERNPRRYMEKALASGSARSFAEVLTRSQAMGEFVFLGLRQLKGLEPTHFTARFGTEFHQTFPQAAALFDEGLLKTEGERISLTPQGLLLADTIFATFF